MPANRKNNISFICCKSLIYNDLQQFSLLFCCFFFLFLNQISAQKTVNLWLTELPRSPLDSSKIELHTFADTIQARLFCQKLVQKLHSDAYLAASIDSIWMTDSLSMHAILYRGEQMQWLSLRPAANLPENAKNWLARTGFKSKKWQQQAIRPVQFFNLKEKWLFQANCNGYPFAEIGMDSLEILENGNVSAVLQLTQNQYFTIKTIDVDGDVRLPKNYLPQFLGIRAGSAFHRQKIENISDRLADLPFLENTAPPLLQFLNNETTIRLFLKKKQAGRFDFLLGVLPRPDASDGRTLITGSLLAEFQNALGYGERIRIDLERLRPETQKLDFAATVPYLLGRPLGLDAHLRVFRRDSSWVEATTDVGVPYLLERGNFFRFFWENRADFLQKIDTLALLSTRRLPEQLDFRQSNFGLEVFFSDLDYRFNPRRGWLVAMKTTAGFSQLRRNPTIENLQVTSEPNFSFSTLYDELAGRTARFRVEGQGAFYQPVFQRSTLKFWGRAAAIFSPARAVFRNEQYRLGGGNISRMTALRGFDEESLFATRFAIGGIEFRLLTGQNAYLAAFFDAAAVQNLTDRVQQTLFPIGVGLGLNVETRAGIFGINIAAGRSNPAVGFDFRALKFHLGYVSLF